MKSLTPAEVHAQPTLEHCLLLDVRTPVEFREKHLAGSTHIPLTELPARISQLDPRQPCILVCQSGKRAEKACRLLSEHNFSQLEILQGGVNAWEEARLPLERAGKPILPLMRQVQLAIGLCVLAGSLLAFFSDPRFALVPAFFGAGLTFAGATGWCGLALLLAKLPWNRAASSEGASCAT